MWPHTEKETFTTHLHILGRYTKLISLQHTFIELIPYIKIDCKIANMKAHR